MLNKFFIMAKSNFYKQAAVYWSEIPATLDGVLGGYGHVSEVDLRESKLFLDKLFKSETPPSKKNALDCGAGIGRITKSLLMPVFEQVDLVEQDEKFINTARESIGEDNAKLGTLYNIGLQHFEPDKKYDVVWCQWVLGHLKDYDLIDFFGRCRDALNPNGVIVVKENICTQDEIEYDEEDSSVTRPERLFKAIFEGASLKVLYEENQIDFPTDLYPVRMYALAPKIKIENNLSS